MASLQCPVCGKTIFKKKGACFQKAISEHIAKCMNFQTSRFKLNQKTGSGSGVVTNKKPRAGRNNWNRCGNCGEQIEGEATWILGMKTCKVCYLKIKAKVKAEHIAEKKKVRLELNCGDGVR